MQLFIIKADGEVHEIKSGKTFKELLNPNESYIINDDDAKKIYLWKGSQCSVRSKFIGASKSQEIRGQVGMHYSVIPMDEGEEPNELLEKLDEAPKSGIAREIREENDLQFEVPGVSSPGPVPKEIKNKAPAKQANFGKGNPVGGGDTDGAHQVMSSAPPTSNSGPLYTGGNLPPSSTTQPSATTTPSIEDTYDFKKVIETLESLEMPEGYEREMIIIGNQAYSIVEKKVTFLGTEKVEKVMERIGSLPEGIFFAKGYAPRVLCENQKVLAIEFMKSIDEDRRDSSSKKLKLTAKDPKELAKSFGMKI